MTRVVDIELERGRVAFAKRAVMHFANHPEHWTYTDGDLEAGELLALRWGPRDHAVLVLRVSDDEPVIYYAADEGDRQ